MQEPNRKAISYQHVHTQDGQRWEFRPCETLAAVVVIWSSGGSSAVSIYLAVYFFRGAGAGSASMWIATFCLLAAGFFIGFGVWAWRSRRTPLTVERGGRVCYGERELCQAGTVRSVRIAGARTGEWGDCEVYLDLHGGKLVSLPSLWFGSVKMREHARPFAAKLATALGVEVSESA